MTITGHTVGTQQPHTRLRVQTPAGPSRKVTSFVLLLTPVIPKALVKPVRPCAELVFLLSVTPASLHMLFHSLVAATEAHCSQVDFKG